METSCPFNSSMVINGHCKAFLKRKFAQWFAQQFDKQLSLGKRVEDIEMKFHLTEIKPIHAKWITQFYDYMSTEDGSKVIINGWKKSGISQLRTDLPPCPLWTHFKPFPHYHNLTVNLVKPSTLRTMILLFILC